jgi:hypothetical protein
MDMVTSECRHASRFLVARAQPCKWGCCAVAVPDIGRADDGMKAITRSASQDLTGLGGQGRTSTTYAATCMAGWRSNPSRLSFVKGKVRRLLVTGAFNVR